MLDRITNYYTELKLKGKTTAIGCHRQATI
jgi:hypothetical protein